MSKEAKTVCGIIMPISHVDDAHSEQHWQKVKAVLEEAVTEAGCTPQPVWESGDFDVIQAKILKNIYENEIVVCDISTRNPNVMLEWGMRLTTKKPTLVIAELGTPLPFDTNIISTEFYDPSLDWPSAKKFIETLSSQITATVESMRAGSYTSYLEHFRFETVTPSTVNVTTEERLERFMGEVVQRLDGLETIALSPQDTFTRPAGQVTYLHSSPTQRGLAGVLAGYPQQADQDPPWPGNAFPENVGLDDRVVHETFGVGRILGYTSDGALLVKFDDGTSRPVSKHDVRKLPL